MSAKPPKAEDGSEDAVSWDRFERAVDSALHTRPQHKPKAKPDPKPTQGRDKD